MPNWCFNTLMIEADTAAISSVKKFIHGEFYPWYREAIDLSIKLFCLGAIGYAKPIRHGIKTPLYPDLTRHGVGAETILNAVYEFWLNRFFNPNILLDEQTSRMLVGVMVGVMPEGDGVIDRLTPAQQADLRALLSKKIFDWGGLWEDDSITLQEMWNAIGKPSYRGEPMDMKQIYPTSLAHEINGFNGGLLNGLSSVYLYNCERYGTKWIPPGEVKIMNETPTHLEVYYETAWTPLDPRVLEAMKQYFSLTKVTNEYEDE